MSFFATNLVGQEVWARRGEVQSAVASGVSAALPVGVITAYYGAAAPSGWLLCDGSAIPGTYAALIALVGANTPDLRGRFVMAKAAAGTGSTLGGTGGSANAVTVSHNHLQDPHTHAVDDDNQGPTTHFVDGDSGNRVCVSAGGAANGLHSAGTEKATFSDIDPHAVHNHSFTVSSPTATNQAFGSSGTDANLPPFLALNMIIKAS
jgi:microcystin-dependent protein